MKLCEKGGMVGCKYPPSQRDGIFVTPDKAVVSTGSTTAAPELVEGRHGTLAGR